LSALEVVLNDLSIQPCALTVDQRLTTLFETFKRVTAVSGVRFFRCSQNVLDCLIDDGMTFSKAISEAHRDLKRFFLSRVANAPFVESLMDGAEGKCVAEARVDGIASIALTYAVLTDGMTVSSAGIGAWERLLLPAEVMELGEDGERQYNAQLPNAWSPEAAEGHGAWIKDRPYAGIESGANLAARRRELLPSTLFCRNALDQLRKIRKGAPVFRHVLTHLRALNDAVGVMDDLPPSIDRSEEHSTTLNHGRYGPMRDFTLPDEAGGQRCRFSNHSKISSPTFRVYFMHLPAESDREAKAVIGYIGPHLPTVKFPD
jgi:hypothetical protein